MTTRPILAVFVLAAAHAAAQQTKPMRPEDTEVWQLVPKVIAPGKSDRDPPSDAVVLFGGGNLGSLLLDVRIVDFGQEQEDDGDDCGRDEQQRRTQPGAVARAAAGHGLLKPSAVSTFLPAADRT